MRKLLSKGLLTLAKAIRAGSGREIENIEESRIIGWLLTNDSPRVFNDPSACIVEYNILGGKEGMPRLGMKLKVRLSGVTKTLKVCGVTFKNRQDKLVALRKSDIPVRFARVPNKHDSSAMAIVVGVK